MSSNATEKTLDPLCSTISGYAVYAQDGTKVGTANDLWPSFDGVGYSFVGLRSSWFFRRHVVSAEGVRIEHDARKIHLALSRQEVNAAPFFEVTEVDAERAFDRAHATPPLTTVEVRNSAPVVAVEAELLPLQLAAQAPPAGMPG